SGVERNIPPKIRVGYMVERQHIMDGVISVSELVTGDRMHETEPKFMIVEMQRAASFMDRCEHQLLSFFIRVTIVIDTFIGRSCEAIKARHGVIQWPDCMTNGCLYFDSPGPYLFDILRSPYIICIRAPKNPVVNV